MKDHHIQLSKWEKDFLDRIDAENIDNLSTKRNDSNLLLVTKSCPCKNIEYITACISDQEIILTCKISHKHFDSTAWDGKSFGVNQRQMIGKAAIEFLDFISGKIIVSQVYDLQKRVIGSGWSRMDTPEIDNEEYENLIKEIYGETYKKEWNWDGEIK
ncbi:hypothetical protein DENIS_3571 [Desulfonema ishimotonii]|uniref:Uncharacterized protein n=1 Tax=Desulfonema ishimotonii TaxID=45657 RepID=A0A401G047_9BACT|nr:hypothetical protein [Desulfonema ishimotonii]GBC62599.1 hypothetical protein DENIS_3571 [Desulfonema ishimotonii]